MAEKEEKSASIPWLPLITLIGGAPSGRRAKAAARPAAQVPPSNRLASGSDCGARLSRARTVSANRSSNATVRLRVPADVIKAKCAPYMQRGKPARRTRMMNMDDYTVVSIYGSEYRGIIQYYLLANDVYRLNRLGWVMETSMLKTLGAP